MLHVLSGSSKNNDKPTHSAKRVWAICVLLMSIGLALFGDCFSYGGGWLQILTREIAAVCRDPDTQWMVVLCLGLYVGLFLFLERRKGAIRGSINPSDPSSQPSPSVEQRGHTLFHSLSSVLASANFWLGALLLFVLLRYVLGYETAAHSAQIPVLLTGIVFGKAVALWARFKSEIQNPKSETNPNTEVRTGRSLTSTRLLRTKTALFVILLLLAGAALWQPDTPRTFQYRDIPRWMGAWNSPNIYGLLMGVGSVLAVGFLVQSPKAEDRSQRSKLNGHWSVFRGLFRVLLCSLAAIACVIGLFKSYSRGTWLGTAMALGYLAWQVGGQWSVASGQKVLRRNVVPLSVLMLSVVILCFWQFRFSQWRPMQRIFSIANPNDFSWRNRVSAWNGAAHMMLDRPFFGFAWGQVEKAYEKDYLAARLNESAAIQVNDFFTLSISAGVPALVCFLMYVGLSLKGVRRSEIGVSSSGLEVGNLADEVWSLDCLQATCRAGAIVLLVGFFFDGGLFNLATGSVFWILLELGRVDSGWARHSVRAVDQKGVPQTAVAPLSRWEVWLRQSAWVLGIAAVSESAILLATPFFGVNNTTLAISRHYLVPPAAVADLNLLATKADWSSRKLRPLLQHSSLANYNRELVNWKLEDATYRNFVLNPLIDPQRDGQLAWRRPLWEYFYLPMRKENDPFSAAQIVLKFLHQRIATVPEGPPTIEEMWEEKRADEHGIQALEVAAFRSVGIPALLNESGQTEVFSQGKWQTLPDNTQPWPKHVD
jgi:hypothetical protein